MALITDPDNLNQGTSNTISDLSFNDSTGANTALRSVGAGFPTLSANEYFEIRDSSTIGNNGLYRAYGTPAANTTYILAQKIDSGSNPANLTAESTVILGNSGAPGANTNSKNVHVDVDQKRIYLLEQGLLSSDGVTEQALYSFLKEEWKNDSVLIKFSYPITAITPEQFEYASGWEPRNVTTPSIRSKKLIRTGGWSEIDSSSVLQKQFVGVVTLGTFEDSVNDNAYYQVGADATDTTSTTSFTFKGPVNEAIETYTSIGNPATCTFATTSTITRASGSFITDGFKVGGSVTIVNATNTLNNGTFTLTAVAALTLTVSGTPLIASGADTNAKLAVDNRKAIKLFLRIRDADASGKTYSSATLAAIGASSGVDNKVFRFPLSNASDLDITETDANIAANSPYTSIRIRYLTSTYNREVDSTTKRDFGIVVDVGTFSQSQGESYGNTTFQWITGGGSVPLGAGESLSDYTGGTLRIHEGAAQGLYTISGTPTDVSGTLRITTTATTAAASGTSFTMQRATPLTATKKQIYEKVQYLLRQSSDIDSTQNVVVGSTADGLAVFVGADLRMGSLTPSNPNGAGSGVIIEGFSADDTNNLFFFDNTGTSRNYPFVAAGSINFNTNLQSDSNAKYWMFFTYSTRTTRTDVAIASASGSSATITSSGGGLPALSVGAYFALSGFATAVNNGVWRVLTYSSSSSMTAIKVNSATVVNESAGPTVNIDKNPIDSPDAIIVKNNSAVDITGNISGQPSVSFDFDYDNNVQGGRTAGTSAPITIRAIGFSTAQFVETTGTITRATGQSFSLVSALERNYSNL